MDCKKLHGRMRDICEGKSGLPPELEQQYRDLWESQRTFGLGDLVEKIIRTLTFGRTKPTPGCGCERRKQRLNRIRLWRRSPPPAAVPTVARGVLVGADAAVPDVIARTTESVQASPPVVQAGVTDVVAVEPTVERGV